jgi:hypothetical protein
MENKETIEEAAERIVKNKVGLHYFGNETSLENLTKKYYVIEGAKWIEERMYSEEEVLEVFEQFQLNLPLHYEFLVKEHLKQFKKK